MRSSVLCFEAFCYPCSSSWPPDWMQRACHGTPKAPLAIPDALCSLFLLQRLLNSSLSSSQHQMRRLLDSNSAPNLSSFHLPSISHSKSLRAAYQETRLLPPSSLPMHLLYL